jgi:hypothetical protein
VSEIKDNGFSCDCGTQVPWPVKGTDTACPSCGITWEHDGVDLGPGARIKAMPGVTGQVSGPACHYCGRTGQPMRPCCDLHPDDMVCAEGKDCLAYIVANTPDPDGAR